MSVARQVHDAGAAWVQERIGCSTRTMGERQRVARRHGIGREFGMLVRGAVLLAIGVFIVGAVFSAIELDDGTNGEADPLYEVMDTVEGVTGDAFEIAPIVLIVIIAVLILAFVREL